MMGCKAVQYAANFNSPHKQNLMGRKRKYRNRTGKTLADTADRHHLYQLAVQCVESEIDMVDDTYREIRGRHAAVLREDFCGTGNTSCEWVRRRPTNTATGFDLDAEVLDWGRRKNVSQLDRHQQSRIQLRQQDVREAGNTEADLILAMNFSYQIFKTRDQLRGYFAAAHAGLAEDGLLMMDGFGGHETWRTIKEKTKHDDFTYLWEQRKFNPITFEMQCHIHFRFPDGSKMKRAFSYEWRMWTLPEIRNLLEEAGFGKSTVYWEGTDEETGEGNDEYAPTEEGEDDPSWIVYIVAEK